MSDRRAAFALAAQIRRCLLAAALTTPALIAPSVGIHAQTPAAATAQTIPARLTDQEFWKFITDISEPNGYFQSDNFLSNELGFQYVIPDLQRTTTPGGIYLGVGPEQNFTYIAELKPKMAIIFDIRRGNLHMHLLYKALFETSANRAEFVSRLFSKPMPARLDSTVTADSIFNAIWFAPTDSVAYRLNRARVRDHLTKTRALPLTPEDLAGIDFVYDAFYYGGPAMDYNSGSRSGIGGGGRGGGNPYPNYADLMVQNDGRGVQRSYLANEANFRFLKDMHQKNLIVPVVGDFAGPTAIRSVGQYIRDRGAKVMAIYVSNVEQYLFRQGDDWIRYYESVATLPIDPTTTFIRSVSMGNQARFASPGGRLPSVLSSVQQLITEYKQNRITGYQDVINLSR